MRLLTLLDTVLVVCYRPNRLDALRRDTATGFFSEAQTQRLENLLMMIGCRFVAFCSILLLLRFIAYSSALGAILPAEVRTTTNSQAYREAIRNFIDQQVGMLVGADAAAQSAARQTLVAEVQGGSAEQTRPSPVFLDVYSELLCNSLKPHVQNPDPRIRLNVAIVAAKVAEQAGNARLEPVILDLLKDPSEAVTLWAVKGCKYLFPTILSNPTVQQDDPLLPAFLQAVQRNLQSGAIVQSAYEALRADQVSGLSTANWEQAASAMVEAMHTLLEIRLADFRKQVPPLSTAEPTATTCLVDARVWRIQTPAQRLRTVQIAADLMSLASQHWSAVDAVRRADLAELISKSAGGIWVVGNMMGSTKVKQAVEGIRLNPTTPAVQVSARVQTIREAIRTMPGFADLKPPPTVEVSSPATSPAAGTP